MFPNFNHEDNSRQHHHGDENVSLLPNPASKSLNIKSLKKLSNLPCCKRPRTDQPNEFVMTDGANDHDAKKIGYDHGRCLSDEKCRIVKQKHGQDIKKLDKRSIKASLKTKFDPCLIISDSASGGIDKLGICSLKTDLHDVTKHVEELSLDELLDGSYKYQNLCAEKGKKTSCGNETFLLSVRKACAILPLHAAADSGGNIASLQNASSLVRDEKDKCSEASSNKGSSLAMLNTSTLYPPKDILGRLAIRTPDLEGFMLNSNRSQGATHMKSFYTTGVPAFSWSFSQWGTSKPGLDSCKFTSPRSAGQSKWVRIGTMSTSNGDAKNCSFSLEAKTLDHIDDFADQQKIDELLQDIELLTESITSPIEGPHHISGTHVVGHNTLIQGSGASASLNYRRFGLLDGRADTSDNPKEDDSKGHLYHQKFEPDVCLMGLPNKLNLVDSPKFDSPFKDSKVGQKEHLDRPDDRFQSFYNYPSKRSTGVCGQSLRHLSAPMIYEPGHSSQLFAAAAILCEMAGRSTAMRTQNDPSMRIKWPRPQKNIKDYKSTSSLEKAKRMLLSSRHQDTFKTKKTLSAHVSNTGGEAVKWSLSPRKLERDHARGNHSARPSGLMQSPIRIEKVYDSQQQYGKETLKASSATYGGNYIKDWSRGKIKRV